jgi:mono-ADP-ribosyltransferase sirtuin 6
MWTASQHTVILTGAGISTSAGISDFRGPTGIWTLEEEKSGKKKKKRKRDDTATAAPAKMDFSKAKPTVTHRAITKLVSARRVDYVITQNVDGLHRRSGLSREDHAVLHGCAFTEKCSSCGAEHFRDTDVGGMSFQKTGKKCEVCRTGDLVDTLLDWEDPLPKVDFERACAECEKADLVVCLGTSLRIEPAGSLPATAKKFVIVNLQQTPYDDKAALVIRGRVDEVMQGVTERLLGDDWDSGDDSSSSIERLWVPKKGSYGSDES